MDVLPCLAGPVWLPRNWSTERKSSSALASPQTDLTPPPFPFIFMEFLLSEEDAGMILLFVSNIFVHISASDPMG